MGKSYVLAFLVILSIFFSSCSAPPKTTEQGKITSAADETASVTLGFSVDDINNITEGVSEYNNFVSYKTDLFRIYRCGSKWNGAVCFFSPKEEDISVILFLAYEGASRSSIQTQSAIKSQKAVMQFCDEHGIAYVSSEQISDSTLIFGVWAKDSPLSQEQLPISVSEFRSPTEFFASEERRNAYLSFLNAFDYEGLNTYISDFVSNNEISINDNIQTFQELLPELIKLKSLCDIRTNEFEGNAVLYYHGVEDVGNEICIVPFLETNSHTGIGEDCILGFIRNDWLFFDKVSVKGGGSEISSSTYQSYDVNRDVLSGSLIIECVGVGSQFSKEFGSAIEAEKGMVRFENTETEKVVDHSITSIELEAMRTIRRIDEIHTSLYYACENWSDM
ncbi:MAG: hypothetical protein RSG53_07830 [Oscillospiraceae bacterium]